MEKMRGPRAEASPAHTPGGLPAEVAAERVGSVGACSLEPHPPLSSTRRPCGGLIRYRPTLLLPASGRRALERFLRDLGNMQQEISQATPTDGEQRNQPLGCDGVEVIRRERPKVIDEDGLSDEEKAK